MLRGRMERMPGEWTFHTFARGWRSDSPSPPRWEPSVCSASGARWRMAAWPGSSPGWARRPPMRSYGAVAALGLTAVSSAIVAHQRRGPARRRALSLLPRRAHGAGRAGRRNATGSARGLAAAFGSTLALTLTNPTTILSFVAVFAGLGLGTAAGDRGVGRPHGLRRLPRIGAVVAAAQRRCRLLPPGADPRAAALGESAFRRAAGRVWRALAAQSRGPECACDAVASTFRRRR